MPMSRPGATEKLTPSTTRISPLRVKKEVRKSFTSRSGCTYRTIYHPVKRGRKEPRAGDRFLTQLADSPAVFLATHVADSFARLRYAPPNAGGPPPRAMFHVKHVILHP